MNKFVSVILDLMQPEMQARTKIHYGMYTVLYEHLHYQTTSSALYSGP